jgi:hypothetical protein
MKIEKVSTVITLSSMSAYSTPPPSPPRLKHSLSHGIEQYQQTLVYHDQCNEGDMILMNYYEWPGELVITYLEKINGWMKEKQWEGTLAQYKAMNWNWKFNVSGLELA